MIPNYNEAQWVGVAFVFLALMLLLGLLARRYVPGLAALFLPSSVIAGFVILLVGPQVLGELTGSQGLIPAEVLEVWRVLPGIFINIVFAGILLGKTLPSLRQIWDLSAPHFIAGTMLSFGQFAFGALVVALVLTPVFGLSPIAGSILEVTMAGGHGTVAGMAQMLDEYGAPELVDLGLGLATVAMVAGIVGGSILVRFAVSSPRIPVARKTTPVVAEGLDFSDAHVAPVDEAAEVPETERGISHITSAFMLIGVATAIGMLILQTLRGVFGALGTDIFDKFPLFPFCVIGGFAVQWVLTRVGRTDLADRRSIGAITGLSLDFLIAAAIGTMSLATLGANIPALLILTIVGVAWSVFALLWLMPRMHPVNWFEHGVADFGQSLGNVATGFVLVDMADPDHRTQAANGFGYKQLTYEPILGGGLITVFSVPLLAGMGTLAFGLVALAITAGLAAWGILRVRNVRSRAGTAVPA